VQKRQSIYVILLFLLVLGPSAIGQPQPCPTEFHYGENAVAGHFAVVNGIRMYYEIYGGGPPLLLIHGNRGLDLGNALPDRAFFTLVPRNRG